MDSKRKLKPSEINANYGDLPARINSYIKDSRDGQATGDRPLGLHGNSPDKLYEEWAYEVGSDHDHQTRSKTHNKIRHKPMTSSSSCRRTRHTCQKKYYEAETIPQR